ncbi:MAG: LegC family aminotransferase [Chromatiales bacterium]|jgi:perosamine synthetase
MNSSSAIDEILQAIAEVVPHQRPVSPHEPEFSPLETDLIQDCLNSGWVSSVGQYVDRFEQQLINYTGIEHAIATVNGTSALHAALHCLGIQANDEVLAPSLTFVGTINPIRYLGAIPHFVDCDSSTLGVDPDKLEQYLQQYARVVDGQCINQSSGRRISALVVVHILGIPAQMPKLADLARRWQLELIEDAAESLGSWIGDQHTGSWGKISTLSFNGNKIVTTGGGGALLTRDKDIAKRLRHQTTTGKLSHPWLFAHDEVAFNYRMPNLNAALGCAQLQRLESFLLRKQQLHQQYVQAFASLSHANILSTENDQRSNHWLNLLLVENSDVRDQLLEQAHASKILLRPFWTPMHQLPMYRDCPAMDLSTTENMFERGVCLPSSPRLAEHDR